MFLLSFWLFVTIAVPYFLLETLIYFIRGRRNEGEISEKALKKLIKQLTRQLRRENVSIQTTERLVRRLSRQIKRRRNAHLRPRNQTLSHLKETNTKNSTSESYLRETMDQTSNENILVSRLNLPRPNIDPRSTLTTDSPNSGENSVLNRLPIDPQCYEDDVIVAMENARVYDTMIIAVKTCLYHQKSFDSPRRHRKDGMSTGMEIVVYRPRYFHNMTLDLTLACEVARTYQDIPAGPTYIDYTRLANIKVPQQFVASLSSLAKFIPDDTEVDRPSCQQQQATPITQPETRKEASFENEYQTSHGFLYDEELFGQRSRYTSRELVKFDEPSDVTDLDLDSYQFEGWEVTDMFATNEAHFGYQSTFDEAMPEYTTVLLIEDTAEYEQRWERACLLAEEIEAEKRAAKENQAKLPKKRKRKNRRAKRLQNQ